MICNNYLIWYWLPRNKLIVVNLLFQLPRAMECDYLPGSQHHGLAGDWIPAASFLFLFHTEFTKTGYQNVFAGFQGSFDQLQQYFHGFNRLYTGKSVCFYHRVDNFGFGKGAE